MLQGRCWIGAASFGVAKAFQSQRTAVAQVRGYKILGPGGSRSVAAVLPAAEIALGLLLVTGVAGQLAAAAATAVFLGFAITVASAVRRGLANDCGCSGALSTNRVRPALVYRNIALALLAAAPAVFGPGDLAGDQFITSSATAAVIVVLAAAVGIHAIFRIRSDRGETRPYNEEVEYAQHQP